MRTLNKLCSGLLLAVLCALICLSAFAAGDPATGTDLGPVVTQLKLTPASRDALQNDTNAWTIPVSTSAATVGFRWQAITGAARYRVILAHDDERLYNIVLTGTSWSAEMTKLQLDYGYTLTVYAYDESSILITSQKISVMLTEKEEEPEVTPAPSGAPDEPQPTMPPSFPHRGGFRRGASTGGSTGIIPGKALTSSHANGTGSMMLYDTLELDLNGEPMTKLCVGSEQASVTLDDGQGNFYATVQDDTLYLAPAEDGACWQISGQLLMLLDRGSVHTVCMVLDNEEYQLDTVLPLQGRTYAALRSLGFTDNTFLWRVDADGLHCLVNGVTYHYDDGILTQEV